MRVESPVRAVIVGCGAVSKMLYVPALQVLERAGDVVVSGLVDPVINQRDELRRSFPAAATYDDLAKCPIDGRTLVIIATPPRFHAEQSIYALRQGAAVLCEKPMAASVGEAEDMLKVARETGGLLAVGIFRRFFPAFEALKLICEQQPLGKLNRFSIQEGGKFAWGAASDSFFRRDLTMGGVFFDLGVYVVDALFWWLGEPLASSYADDAMGGVEANCLLELTYPNGVSGSVRLSRDWKTRNSYDFMFEKGTVAYRTGMANHLHMTFNGVPLSLDGLLRSVRTSTSGMIKEVKARDTIQSFTEQLRNVTAAMRGDQAIRVTGDEAIRSLRFIAKCYADRNLMDMPWLTRAEQRAAMMLSTRTA